MKLNSILVLGVASMMAIAACQKTAVTPSGDAVVGFESPEFNSGMGSEYIHIPIVTTGETTVYPIKVYIEAGEYTGAWAANEDVDYIITSKEIFVASPDSNPSVEVKLINPNHSDELNFKLVIASQENAQSIGQKEVLVKCVMSELDRICGKWDVVGEKVSDPQTGATSAVRETWTISNVGGRPVITGMLGYSDGEITGYFDEGSKKLTFFLGEGSGNMLGVQSPLDLTDGTHYDNAYIGPVFINRQVTSYQKSCQLVGVVSDDHDSIVWQIPSNYGIGLLFFSYDDYMTDLAILGDYPMFIDNNTITRKD